MLLLLFAGAKSSKIVTTCCFQPSGFQKSGFQNCSSTLIDYCAFQADAYQNDAYQNCGVTKKVGWPDTLRRRIPRKDLERLLELQKNNTFGDRWFAEFEAAQAQFAEDEKRAALAVAAQEACRAAELIDDKGILELGATLQVAAETKNYELAADIAKLARQVSAQAESAELARRWRQDADDEMALLTLLGAVDPKDNDDDEAILVLSH